MPLSLYPHQQITINETRAHLLAGRQSVLIQGSTGSGKTVLAAHMISGAVERGKRAWFTVHRQELVRQSIETLEESAGLQVGIIAAGFGANGYAPAQVCSIQTLMRRWQKYSTVLPDLLVVDEAAHAVSKSWSDLIGKLKTAKPSMKIIGLTATPERTDGRGLRQWFEVMVQGPSPALLMEQGFLARYKLFAPSVANLSTVHTVAGDYNKAELDDAMRHSCVVGDAIAEYKARCMGKRALMFLWSVKASEEMARAFNEQNIPAAHIDGMTNDVERARVVRDFGLGRIKVLTNCEIVVEGYNCPAIDAVFLLRPTQSLSMYLQMVGRGLRPSPDKSHVLIMDHSGLWQRHGLPDQDREWSLDGSAGRSKAVQKHPVRQCLRCYAVWPATARKCKECGFEFIGEPRTVNQEAGELAEIDMAAAQRLLAAKNEKYQRKDEQAKADSLEALVNVGRSRSYRDPEGWARHILEARQKKRSAVPKYGDDERDSIRTRMPDRRNLFSMAAANRPKGK